MKKILLLSIALLSSLDAFGALTAVRSAAKKVRSVIPYSLVQVRALTAGPSNTDQPCLTQKEQASLDEFYYNTEVNKLAKQKEVQRAQEMLIYFNQMNLEAENTRAKNKRREEEEEKFVKNIDRKVKLHSMAGILIGIITSPPLGLLYILYHRLDRIEKLGCRRIDRIADRASYRLDRISEELNEIKKTL